MPLDEVTRIATGLGELGVIVDPIEAPTLDERTNGLRLLSRLAHAAVTGHRRARETLIAVARRRAGAGIDERALAEVVADLEVAIAGGMVVLRDVGDLRPPLQDPPSTPLVPPLPPAPQPPPKPVTTWFEVAYVDEVGQPVPGLSVEIASGGDARPLTTDGSGVARFDGATISFGATRLLDVSGALTLLEPRWAQPRSGTPPSGADVVTAPLADPFSSVSLEKEKRKTVVLSADLTRLVAEKITYKNDHGLMKVNTTDWTKTGPDPTKPHWTRGGEVRPVSYTMGKPIELDLELSAVPPKGPVEALHVTAQGQGLEGDGKVRGGSPPIAIASAALPKKVQVVGGDFPWRAKIERTSVELDAGTSPDHTIFSTLDTPVSVSGREEGITEKRMDAAVRLVAGAKSNDPHKIVAHLMSKFGFYTLRPDPAVPAEYKHPTYFNTGPGAWPMAEFISKSGECQAIVRFVRAAIKQVGCPGDAELVVVWADPDVQNGNKALEAVSPPGGGLANKSKVVNGTTWGACLVDAYPEEGKVYDTEELNANYMGLNNFEACLRFEHGGVKKYYGGGAGVYSSPQQVILAFFALAWVSFTTLPNGHSGAKVEKVVKRWRDKAGNVL